MRWTRFKVLLAFTLLGAGCSEPDHNEPAHFGVIRLDLRGGEPSQVTQFLPSQHGSRWTVEGDPENDQPEDSVVETEGNQVWRLGGERSERLILTEPFDLRIANRVKVLARCSGDQPIQLVVLGKRKGRGKDHRVTISEEVELLPSGEPVALEFDLPIRPRRTSCDDLRVRAVGTTGTFFVHSVSLAGAKHEGAHLLGLGTEWRRGYRMSLTSPLICNVLVENGMELAYSYGIESYADLSKEGLAFKVYLQPEGGEAEVVTHNFGSAQAWEQGVIDLAAYVGTAVNIRFELSSKVESQTLYPFLADVIVRGADSSSTELKAPNVLLVTSDTHRADHVGLALTRPLVETPNIDALARRGVLFEDCFSSTNVTLPSHVALMTSVHPRDTRVVLNHVSLADSASTLAEHFSAAGYRTFASVSATHLSGHSGLGQGFDRLRGPTADHPASRAIEVMEGWIADTSNESLFMWVHLMDAHSPYTPPEPFDRKYYGKDRDPFDPGIEREFPERATPGYLKGLRDSRFPQAQYRAEIDYLDSELAALFDHPCLADSVVAFTSDHGESLGFHGRVWWGHAELYPDSVHVPMILTWPGAPAGSRVGHPVRQMDLGRTLLNIVGIKAKGFGGADLRDSLEQARTKPRFALGVGGATASMNSDGWLLMMQLKDHYQRHLTKPRFAHEVELYNIRDDPGCHEDLLEKDFARAKRMRQALIDWLAAARSDDLLGSSDKSEDEMRELADLGYTGDEEIEQELWYEPDPDNEWCSRFE